jgi:hypothetical protein
VIAACTQFISARGKQYEVHHVTAAYNIQTKEARIYAEFERVSEKVIEDNMKNMGAGSVVIDSFSSEDWERSSEIAFRSVVECGKRQGLLLSGMETSQGHRLGKQQEEAGLRLVVWVAELPATRKTRSVPGTMSGASASGLRLLVVGRWFRWML